MQIAVCNNPGPTDMLLCIQNTNTDTLTLATGKNVCILKKTFSCSTPSNTFAQSTERLMLGHQRNCAASAPLPHGHNKKK